MERVHRRIEGSQREMPAAAVSIADHRGQRHVGLVYRDGDTIWMLHLAWHFQLERQAPHLADGWVNPNVSNRRLRQVAAICRLAWSENADGRIPFGFSPPNDSLDGATGRFLLSAAGFGLTCATFVLSVFHAAGIPVVRYSTWPTDRLEDRAWQAQIVGLLEKHGADPAHIAGVASDIGSVRFRPEEVAGAASLTPWPVEFQAAAHAGNQILIYLTSGIRPRRRGILQQIGRRLIQVFQTFFGRLGRR